MYATTKQNAASSYKTSHHHYLDITSANPNYYIIIAILH